MSEALNRVIPNHLLIETIKGICSARCVMCDIKKWAESPHIMDQQTFENILAKFAPYRDDIKFVSLFWRGEPLLDKGISKKVKAAKRMKFNSVGFSTNCTNLTLQKSCELLESGLDTLICCIDGYTAGVHELIRRGTNFDEVVKNTLNFIKLRDTFGFRTKVVIRFLRQKWNYHEEPDFIAFWESKLNKSYGDSVEPFPVVSCNGEKLPEEYDSIDALDGVEVQSFSCKELDQRMIVTSRGNVNLCCGDGNESIFMGSVLTMPDPVDIYNNESFTYYRHMMKDGRKSELPICDKCTAPRSHTLRNNREVAHA